MPRSDRGKRATFWSIAVGVVIADVISKRIAAAALMPSALPIDVAGQWLRFSLVFNRGAAFGLHLGRWSREIFLVLTAVVLIGLAQLYRAARPADRLRVVALALVFGGAVGNLIDRVRSPVGVVDFIDVGYGTWRWPTFNVADMAVSIGAVLLAWALWGEDEEAEVAPEAGPEPKATQSA